MVKRLTTIGNRKAVILPAKLAKKFSGNKVDLKETEEGILIKAISEKSSFQKEVDLLRKNKARVYSKIEMQANQMDTKEYYLNNTI